MAPCSFALINKLTKPNGAWEQGELSRAPEPARIELLLSLSLSARSTANETRSCAIEESGETLLCHLITERVLSGALREKGGERRQAGSAGVAEQ